MRSNYAGINFLINRAKGAKRCNITAYFLKKNDEYLEEFPTQLAQLRCENVVTTSLLALSQRCDTVEKESVPTSVSDVVTTSLCDVIKTLQQRCCNVTTTFSIGFLGHFTTDYFDLFPFIET